MQKILFYDDFLNILGSEGGGNAGPVANFQIWIFESMNLTRCGKNGNVEDEHREKDSQEIADVEFNDT